MTTYVKKVSGTQPVVRANMRPAIEVDVLSLMEDDDPPPTIRRPDLAIGLAKVMSAYPEFL